MELASIIGQDGKRYIISARRLGEEAGDYAGTWELELSNGEDPNAPAFKSAQEAREWIAAAWGEGWELDWL